MLLPGQRPRPDLPEGVDTLPQIEHIVVLMMENHSFDSYFGMLGRGDGFTLGADGKPSNRNPVGDGTAVTSFHMPSTCQLHALPGQDWNRSHTSLGANDNSGFVKASTAVAMGYWDGTDIPFYWSLARTFPLCDRWFGSCLAQTYPNRRFLLAGTALGLVDDPFPKASDPQPPNGTITERLDSHGISWRNYFTSLPTTALFLPSFTKAGANAQGILHFFDDAKRGALPAFSIVDPDFGNQSEENPQDIRNGEAFAAAVINAVLQSPAWPKTLLIWCYDEHGGYYDHVVPPAAVPPDDVPPAVSSSFVGGFDRYGFRVPAVMVSPYAKRGYVSHAIHDHTSILKLVETKWNLPALTRRDGAADDLLDSLDLHSPPAFLEPPTLAAPALAAGPDACKPGEPGGPIPPTSAVVPA